MAATERTSSVMVAVTCSGDMIVGAAGAALAGSTMVMAGSGAVVARGGGGRVLVGGPNIADTRLIGFQILPGLLRRK
jgi:hypothetical protein